MAISSTTSSHVRYLTPPEVASRLGLTLWHLSQLRRSGQGPEFIRFGYRTVKYAESAVDAWVASRSSNRVSA